MTLPILALVSVLVLYCVIEQWHQRWWSKNSFAKPSVKWFDLLTFPSQVSVTRQLPLNIFWNEVMKVTLDWKKISSCLKFSPYENKFLYLCHWFVFVCIQCIAEVESMLSIGNTESKLVELLKKLGDALSISLKSYKRAQEPLSLFAEGISLLIWLLLQLFSMLVDNSRKQQFVLWLLELGSD